MAFIVFNQGGTRTLPAERAAQLYKVLHGEIEGTPEQEEFCLKIKHVYLNPGHPSTPESYKQRHPVEVETSYKSNMFPVKASHV